MFVYYTETLISSGFDHLSLQLCCWCWKQTCS